MGESKSHWEKKEEIRHSSQSQTPGAIVSASGSLYRIFQIPSYLTNAECQCNI